MPEPAAPSPVEPSSGPLRRGLSLRAAAVAAVLVGALVAIVHGRDQDALSARERHEASALARAAAVAVEAAAPGDPVGLLERLRDATPGVLAVTLRDASNAVLARAARSAGPDEASRSGELVGRAPLAADAALAPGGALEVTLARSPAAGLLAWTTVLLALLGVALVVAVALTGSVLAARPVEQLRELRAYARSLARGDLRATLPAFGDGEVAGVSDQFEELARGLRRTVSDLRAGAEQVRGATATLGATSQTQVRTVLSQTSALQETATAMAEMAMASRLATESAQLVIEVAGRSEKLWHEGAEAVRVGMGGLGSLDERVSAIAGAVTELSDRTVQIGGIIAAVKDLAEQSDVLALNAAIEAAKVGDTGKGFAVVAEEMRRLAVQSRRATDEVRGMLVQLQRATRNVVVATDAGSEQAWAARQGAEQARSTIQALAAAIEDSSRTARGIADTTRRQTDQMAGVASAIEYLLGNMSEAVAGAQRVEEVAQELKKLSEELAETISVYRL